jgi:hypothetical protein
LLKRANNLETPGPWPAAIRIAQKALHMDEGVKRNFSGVWLATFVRDETLLTKADKRIRMACSEKSLANSSKQGLPYKEFSCGIRVRA